jgi:hypothetical protein
VTEDMMNYYALSVGNHDIKIANRCFENVVKLKYFGTTVENQNLIREENKWKLNSRNGRYHSFHNFCLLVCCLKM